MGSLSVWHWLIVLVVVLVTWVIPLAKVLMRAGFSPLWVVVSFVPILNIVGLWVFAYSRWPGESRT